MDTILRNAKRQTRQGDWTKEGRAQGHRGTACPLPETPSPATQHIHGVPRASPRLGTLFQLRPDPRKAQLLVLDPQTHNASK